MDFSAVKAAVSFPQAYKALFPDLYRERGNFQCAWHNDKTPSLQPFPNGGVCHACGKPFDIFDLYILRYGISSAEAYRQICDDYCLCSTSEPPEKPRSKQSVLDSDYFIEGVHNYTDEKGENILYQVRRYRLHSHIGKNGDQREKKLKTKEMQVFIPDQKGGWTTGVNQVRHVLYNLPQVVDPQSTVVFLAEGEKCAEALQAVTGITSTCVPFGAKNWDRQVFDHNIDAPLHGKKVFIFPDNDEPGRDFAESAITTLKPVCPLVRIVDIPGLKDKEDIADFIEICRQKQLDPGREVLALVDFAGKTPEKPRFKTGLKVVTEKELLAMVLPDPEFIIDEILPEGLCILAGAPKLGKSFMALSVCHAVADGIPFLNHFQGTPGKALYFGLEDNERRLKTRLEKALQHFEPTTNFQVAFQCSKLYDDDKKGNKVSGIIEQIEEWLDHQDGQGKLVIIDTLQKIRTMNKDKSKINAYHVDYDEVGKLQKLAIDRHIALICITHTNKSTHADPLHSITGSSGSTGAADTIWILSKSKRNAQFGSFFVSGRDVEPINASLQHDPDTGRWDWVGLTDEVECNTTDEEVHSWMISHALPVTRGEIATILGRPNTTIRSAITRLANKGLITPIAGSKGKLMAVPKTDKDLKRNQ